jgi:hypothetical protein
MAPSGLDGLSSYPRPRSAAVAVVGVVLQVVFVVVEGVDHGNSLRKADK